MKRTLLLATIAFVFTLTNCEKAYEPGTGTPVDNTDNGDNGNNGNNGGNNGGDNGTHMTCDYFPYEVGKFVVYKDSLGNLDTINFTVVETIESQEWVKGIESVSGESTHFRCNGTYGMIRDLQTDLGITTSFRVVKINGAVNDTWYDEFEVQGFTFRVYHTITGKDITKTVEGTTYNDVMSLDVEVKIVLNGMESTQESYTEFYSKKFGKIDDGSSTLVAHNF